MLACKRVCRVGKGTEMLAYVTVRAIEIENAVNKAVMKMRHDALGAFEAKRSHSWLSDLTSKNLRLHEVRSRVFHLIASPGRV